MYSLSTVIGDDRSLRLTFASEYGDGITECWEATLIQQTWPDEDDFENVHEVEIARARIARVDVNNPSWLMSLDAESRELEVVGDALADTQRLYELDPDAFYAENIVILDRVDVPEEHRGHRASHALIRGIALVFRNEIIALTPASLSTDASGKLYYDAAKHDGLSKHWKAVGFVRLKGTDVWILPQNSRPRIG